MSHGKSLLKLMNFPENKLQASSNSSLYVHLKQLWIQHCFLLVIAQVKAICGAPEVAILQLPPALGKHSQFSGMTTPKFSCLN